MNTWIEFIKNESEQEYFLSLKENLKIEKSKGRIIYPPTKQIFTAFDITPFESIKIVVLGMDPYIGHNQAHGLAFSTLDKSRPKSLQNICQEIRNDIYTEKEMKDIFVGSNLTCWANQGVFLLNTTLTVQEGLSGSHEGIGWEVFTGRAIDLIAKDPTPKVFMLWGKKAKQFSNIIKEAGNDHLILEAAHPSPFSASSGFFDCKHFSKANIFLKENGSKKIDWRIWPTE
jgi:uracil-DNA glycosylase